MQQTLQLLLAAALLGAALGANSPHQKHSLDALALEFDEVAPAPGPVPPKPVNKCLAYIDQKNCSADDCCTW
jgi:hypothetical protein